MKIESERLFGIPYAICRIDPWSYNKKEIVKDIESNYLKNPIRNNWRPKNYNIHHAYRDWDNPDYIKSDYSRLIEAYKKIMYPCLESCGVKKIVSGNLRLQIIIVWVRVDLWFPIIIV